MIFYGVTLLVISSLIGALWAAAASDRSLLRPGVGEEEVQAVLFATSPNIAFYAGVTAIAVVLPEVAAFGYLAIAIILVLRAKGDEGPSTVAGSD